MSAAIRRTAMREADQNRGDVRPGQPADVLQRAAHRELPRLWGMIRYRQPNLGKGQVFSAFYAEGHAR